MHTSVFNSLHVGIRCVQLVAKGGQESLHLLTATLTVSLHSPVYIHCMNVIVWGGREREKHKYLSILESLHVWEP